MRGERTKLVTVYALMQHVDNACSELLGVYSSWAKAREQQRLYVEQGHRVGQLVTYTINPYELDAMPVEVEWTSH